MVGSYDPPDYMLYPKGRSVALGNHAEIVQVSDKSETVTGRNPANAVFSARKVPFPCDSAALRAWEDRLNRLPIAERLGARFDLGDPHAVRVRIEDAQPYHLGGMGIAAFNGSVLSGIVDCAIGAAGIIHFSGTRAGTLNFTLNFLKPVFGKLATAECIVTRRTDSLLFTEAYVVDQRGRICVTAIGIVSRVGAPSRDGQTL